jgi:hypothetical protein
LKKSRLLVKHFCRKRESPIPIPQTESAFHRDAQHNAFLRHDARPRSRCTLSQHQPAKDYARQGNKGLIPFTRVAIPFPSRNLTCRQKIA